MAAHRTFGSYDANATPVTGPTFVLQGGPPLSAEVWSETFTCLATAPAGVLDDLASVARVTPEGTQVFDNPSILRFMRGVLVDGDVERFNALVHDRHRLVHAQTLGDIFTWLSEELTGRPSMPPSD